MSARNTLSSEGAFTGFGRTKAPRRNLSYAAKSYSEKMIACDFGKRCRICANRFTASVPPGSTSAMRRSSDFSTAILRTACSPSTHSSNSAGASGSSALMTNAETAESGTTIRMFGTTFMEAGVTPGGSRCARR
jgi:hypothetical protein